MQHGFMLHPCILTLVRNLEIRTTTMRTPNHQLSIRSDGDGNGNSAPLVVSNPATSSTFRSQRIRAPMMADLVIVVGEMVVSIKILRISWRPCMWRWWLLRAKVSNCLKRFLLSARKGEWGWKVMVKRMDMSQAWIKKYLTRLSWTCYKHVFYCWTCYLDIWFLVNLFFFIAQCITYTILN